MLEAMLRPHKAVVVILPHQLSCVPSNVKTPVPWAILLFSLEVSNCAQVFPGGYCYNGGSWDGRRFYFVAAISVLLLFLSKSKGTDFQKQKIFFFRPGFEHCCGPWHRPDCKVRWGERCPDPLWSLVQPWTLSSSLSSIQALTRNEGCPRHCDRAWFLDGTIFFFYVQKCKR